MPFSQSSQLSTIIGWIETLAPKSVLDVYFRHLESWLRERPDVWAGWRDFERPADN